MRMSRFVGAGIAMALAGGALTAAPTLAEARPAQAAIVTSPVVTAASTKPKIKTQPVKRRIVTVNKTTTFSVKATGGSLKYQWYYASPNMTTWKKVAGTAGKKRTLSVKATLARTGYDYRVVVTNAKGRAVSRTSTLFVRSTVAKPFAAQKVAATPRWAMSTISSTVNIGNGTTAVAMGLVIGNATNTTRNPKSTVTIAFRANNGKLYSDLNASGQSGETGIKTVGSIKPGNVKIAYAAVQVPSSLVKGGRWVVKDKATPAMTLYFAQ